MNIRILGSGPNEPVIGGRVAGRLQSSVLVDGKILLDATTSIRKQLSDKDKVKAILISHAHMDCIAGLNFISEFVDGKVPVFGLKHTLEFIPERLGKKVLSNIKLMAVEPYKAFDLFGHNILPIPVEHSVLQQQFDPTLAWCVDKEFVYCEDIDYKFFFSEKSEKLRDNMKKAKLTILDGAMSTGKIRGHLNIYQAADFLNKEGYNNILFTQIGRSGQEQVELAKQIRSINKTYNLSYDGQILDTLTTSELEKSVEGVYLTESHAKMIWQGNKSIIIKNMKFDGILGKLYYLVGGNDCYGVIKFKDVKQINLQDFNTLSDKHKVKEEERKEWWPDNKVLFAYSFDLVKKFDCPQLVKVPSDAQPFIHNIEFLAEIEARSEELIKDISSYNPTKLDLPILRDDFRIALAWYCSKKSGRKIKYSQEEIENLIQLIMEELGKRKNTEFHPENMQPCAKEAFDKIYARIKTGKLSEPVVPDFVPNFKNAIIIKDFISLVGSSVQKNTYNDIDLLIRLSSPSSFIKRAIETRLEKMDAGDKKRHYIWGDSEGPHDSFVPLYDLALIRTKSELIKMSESISPMTAFMPMKPEKRFYEIDKLIDYLFGDGSYGTG